MKRSDLIDHIVYTALSWDGLDTNGVPAEEIAEDVLSVIESVNMLGQFTAETVEEGFVDEKETPYPVLKYELLKQLEELAKYRMSYAESVYKNDFEFKTEITELIGRIEKWGII